MSIIATQSMNKIQEFEDEFHLPIKLQVKCVVLGTWGVGKTQLLARYMTDTFNPDYNASKLEQFSFNVDVSGETVQVRKKHKIFVF